MISLDESSTKGAYVNALSLSPPSRTVAVRRSVPLASAPATALANIERDVARVTREPHGGNPHEKPVLTHARGYVRTGGGGEARQHKRR